MCDAKVKISIQCNESSKASLETYFCPTPPPKKKKEKIGLETSGIIYYKKNHEYLKKYQDQYSHFFVRSHCIIAMH